MVKNGGSEDSYESELDVNFLQGFNLTELPLLHRFKGNANKNNRKEISEFAQNYFGIGTVDIAQASNNQFDVTVHNDKGNFSAMLEQNGPKIKILYEKGKTYYNPKETYCKFGENDPIRFKQKEKLLNIVRSPSELPSKYSDASKTIRRGHVLGYIPPIYPHSTVLTCLCFEPDGIGLPVYPSLEIVTSLKKLGHNVRVLIPSYEYLTYGLIPEESVKKYTEECKALFNNKGFEVIDTLEEPYHSKRNNKSMEIMPHMSSIENPDHAYPLDDTYTSVGKSHSYDKSLRRVLGVLEIADILLCMEQNGDTIVVSDDGCVGPVITAKKLLKKQKIEAQLGAIPYLEPSSLNDDGFMCHKPLKDRLYLSDSKPEKILYAVDKGGMTKEDFIKYGGCPSDCVVYEIDSLINPSDDALKETYEKCKNGTLKGCCGEHKKQIVGMYKEFMKQLRS